MFETRTKTNSGFSDLTCTDFQTSIFSYVVEILEKKQKQKTQGLHRTCCNDEVIKDEHQALHMAAAPFKPPEGWGFLIGEP